MPAPVKAQRLGELDQRSRRRAIARVVATVIGAWVLLLTVYYVLPVSGWGTGATFVRLGLAILGFCAVVAWQTRGIMRSQLPELRAVQAFGVAVPLLFVVFSTAYLAMSSASASEFNMPLDHTRALYFVVTVFATVGFGDIVPRSDTARVVVIVQMMFDLVVIGFVIRLMVATAKASLARSERRGGGGGQDREVEGGARSEDKGRPVATVLDPSAPLLEPESLGTPPDPAGPTRRSEALGARFSGRHRGT